MRSVGEVEVYKNKDEASSALNWRERSFRCTTRNLLRKLGNVEVSAIERGKYSVAVREDSGEESLGLVVDLVGNSMIVRYRDGKGFNVIIELVNRYRGNGIGNFNVIESE